MWKVEPIFDLSPEKKNEQPTEEQLRRGDTVGAFETRHQTTPYRSMGTA
jgi:hypothetical protein